MTAHNFNGGQFAPAYSKKNAAATLTILDIAKQLGVSKPVMITVRPYLAGFPKPKRVGKQQLYSAAGFKKWLNGRDVAKVAQLVRDAYASARHTRARQYTEKSARGVDAKLANEFATGLFLTAEQRERCEFKKLVARTTQPKTTRVTVVPDWMQD